jgi:TonB-linked SusC/RagA family outer membrane protein
VPNLAPGVRAAFGEHFFEGVIMRLFRPWSVGSYLRPTLIAVAAMLLPGIAAAQQASISGRVTAAPGGTLPLGDTRVFLVGTSLATTTNSEGRYTLRGVPTGAVEVRVIHVGFQEQKKAVTVAAGGTATLDFSMVAAVVKLQEVVTTATGQQRKVELGHSITTLGDIGQNVETKPVTNLADLMVAKAPGVSVLPGNMTGSAPVIRIRGTNSLSLNNEPIYVVDGVRISSNSIGLGTGGTSSSYLSTLNPEEIEDIEIVKGPSAATLYGTDAANGVVVITTKKGRAGATQWTWHAEGGAVQDRNDYPTQYANWGHCVGSACTAAELSSPVRCVLVTISGGIRPNASCVQDSVTSYNLLKTAGVTPISTGHRDQYGGQMSGGSDQVRFFVSGDLENEIGPLKMPSFGVAYFDSVHTKVRDEWLYPEALQRNSFRANVNAALSPKFDLAANAGFGITSSRLPQVDNNTFSYLYNAFQNPGFVPKAGLDGRLGYSNIGGLGEDKHGYGFYTPAQLFQRLQSQQIQRTTASVDGQWRPFTWMQNQGNVGFDLADRTRLSLCRFAECPASGTTRLGSSTTGNFNDRNFSAKVLSTSSWSPRADFNFKTTFGADYVNLEGDNSRAIGSQLPPGAQSPDQAAVQTVAASLPTAVKTLGLYAQELIAFNDRMFLTIAARTDQNSAFGTSFQRVVYPKASLSWSISDESYFPAIPKLNSLRLRAAYGASGVQPGPTAALQTFDAQTINLATSSTGTSGTDTPGLLASALGNPNLKPERSAEYELGFDSRLVDNKVVLDFTYYNKKTTDALVDKPIAASSGASQLTVQQNIGSVQNTGVEATLTTTLLDRRQLGWDMTIAASHNSNKIVSLGYDATGNPNPTIGTGATRDSLGLPANARFFRPFTYSDANNDGIITKDEVTVLPGDVYAGYSQPRDIISVSNGFDLLNRKLHLNMLVDYKGGATLLNATTRFYCQQTLTCYDETHKETSLYNQARLVAVRYSNPNTQYGYLESGQFWRLREVSSTLTLPNKVAGQLRARDASLTFSARNLHIWTNYTGTDPEANYATGDIQTDFSTTAPPTYFTLRLNLHY